MISVFYQGLSAKECDLSPAEKIVYSFIVYHSICDMDCAFDKELGTFDEKAVRETIWNENRIISLPMKFFNDGKFCVVTLISKSTNISIGKVSEAIKSLSSKGLLDLDNGYVFVTAYIHISNYFKLHREKNKRLRGELLIFYSWLVYLTRNNNGIIYTTQKKLSQMYHCNRVESIQSFFARLKELHLLVKDENDKYKVII